jgi:hypothetical protein
MHRPILKELTNLLLYCTSAGDAGKSRLSPGPETEEVRDGNLPSLPNSHA